MFGHDVRVHALCVCSVYVQRYNSNRTASLCGTLVLALHIFTRMCDVCAMIREHVCATTVLHTTAVWCLGSTCFCSKFSLSFKARRTRQVVARFRKEDRAELTRHKLM